MIKSNNGQLGGIITFSLLIIILIILAPIILKVSFSIMDNLSNKFSTIDTTNKSADFVVFTKTKLIDVFDWVIVLIFIFNCLLLLITAFLIDINPVFVIIYIIGVFVLILTAPLIIAVAEKIYTSPDFSMGTNNVIQYIPMTQFILNNFGLIIVGIIILSGIIMYAKIKFFPKGSNFGNNY